MGSIFREILSPINNPTPKSYFAMETHTTQAPDPEEIQVYRSDFISGVILLTKKLFML